MKLRVEGILFDLDGTIVDSREAYLEAAKAAFRTVGQRMVDVSIVTEIPRRLEQNLPLDNLLKGIDTQKFLEAYLKAYYQATCTMTRPMPAVSETLKKLSEKAKLGIITMRHVEKENVRRELEHFGFAKYFRYIITALDTHNQKPFPDALMQCARQLDIQMCKCVVVGDSVVDIKAGKNAGAQTVAVLSGIFSLKELKMENPDLILENVNNLPDFVE